MGEVILLTQFFFMARCEIKQELRLHDMCQLCTGTNLLLSYDHVPLAIRVLALPLCHVYNLESRYKFKGLYLHAHQNNIYIYIHINEVFTFKLCLHVTWHSFAGTQFFLTTCAPTVALAICHRNKCLYFSLVSAFLFVTVIGQRCDGVQNVKFVRISAISCLFIFSLHHIMVYNLGEALF
jgi:hypothetical protein